MIICQLLSLNDAAASITRNIHQTSCLENWKIEADQRISAGVDLAGAICSRPLPQRKTVDAPHSGDSYPQYNFV